jgi:hypothetical protein
MLSFVASTKSHELTHNQTARNHIYYLEADCDGHGRIMRTEVFPHRKILPDKYNVGSSVNGYGGGAFIVDCDGRVVFVDGVTNAVHRTGTTTWKR